MAPLEWTQAERADLLDIVDYISDDNPEAAQRLKDDIEAMAAKLPSHPKRYRTGRVAGTREMLVRYNYILVYAESDKAISVVRVLHTSRQWPPGPAD